MTDGIANQGPGLSQPGEPEQTPDAPLAVPEPLSEEEKTRLFQETADAAKEYEALGKPLADVPEPYKLEPQPPEFTPKESPLLPGFKPNTISPEGKERLDKSNEEYLRLLAEFQEAQGKMFRNWADTSDKMVRKAQEMLDNLHKQ